MKQHDLKISNETDLLNKTIKDLTEKLIVIVTYYLIKCFCFI
jgi:hypothetical protein